MPVELECYSDEPILVLTFTNPVDYERLALITSEMVSEAAEGMAGPIYRVSDYTQLTPSFTDLMMALGGARNAKKGGLKDARMRPLLVSDHDVARFGRMALDQLQYNLSHAKLFATLDEALAYARQQIEIEDEETRAGN